jgi:hypothetical protein
MREGENIATVTCASIAGFIHLSARGKYPETLGAVPRHRGLKLALKLARALFIIISETSDE